MVVSSVGFVTAVFLGRWCGAGELGAYSLALTIVVLVVGAQMALIAIPYTNHFRRVEASDRRDFAGCCLIQQFIFTGVVTLILATIVLVCTLYGGGGVARTVATTLLPVLPPILLRDFARRFEFAHLRIGTALVMDSFVAFVQIAGLVLLLMTGRLNAASAFLVTGIGAGVGSVTALILMRDDFSFRVSLLRTTVATHWIYGRWVLASTWMAIVQGYLMYWLLALTAGTVETGVFAGCMTVVQLMNPLVMALGNLLEPKAAFAVVEHGQEFLRRTIWRLTALMGALTSLYFMVLLVAGGWLVSMLYAGSEFAGRGHLVSVLALKMSVNAISVPLSHGLRAMNRPDLNFRATAASLLVTVVAGLLLVPTYGVLLGAYAMLLGALSGIALRILLFAQLSTHPHFPLQGLRVAVEVGGNMTTNGKAR
jgi:O-antigen/teichoic acid export membrane protein